MYTMFFFILEFDDFTATGWKIVNTSSRLQSVNNPLAQVGQQVDLTSPWGKYLEIYNSDELNFKAIGAECPDSNIS